MNGTGVIDTTLNDADYKDQKNHGGSTANHGGRWRQCQSYFPGKGINLKCNGTKCQLFQNKCLAYSASQQEATYQDKKGGSEAMNH